MAYRVIYNDSDGLAQAVDVTASGSGVLEVRTEGGLLVFYDTTISGEVHVFRNGDVLNYIEL